MGKKGASGQRPGKAATPLASPPAEIRIAGDNGCAITLTQVPVYAPVGSFALEELGFDITITDPGRTVCYRNRVMATYELGHLADFLRAAMLSDKPTRFAAALGGFELAVRTAGADRLEVEISISRHPSQPFSDTEEAVLTMTRAALWGASQAAVANAEAARVQLAHELPLATGGETP